jgi:hypothetical protein
MRHGEPKPLDKLGKRNIPHNNLELESILGSSTLRALTFLVFGNEKKPTAAMHSHTCGAARG